MGNLPLETSAKQLKSLFKEHGEIEKVWFRSIACDVNSPLPHKAKIILSQFGEQKDSKNAYLLFSTKEEAKHAASHLNQV